MASGLCRKNGITQGIRASRYPVSQFPISNSYRLGRYSSGGAKPDHEKTHRHHRHRRPSHAAVFHQAPPFHRARRGDLRLGRVGEALHRLHRRVGRHLPGARAPRHHRSPDRAGPEDHPKPELGAHLLTCPRAAHRPAHGDPSFEPDAGLFRQQRRRGKRCRDQAGPEGHGPDGCRLDGAELSRPDDQHGLGHGPGQAPRALQPAHAQLHLRSLRRRRGHRRGDG